MSVFGLGLDPKDRRDLTDEQRTKREQLRKLVAEVGDSGALRRYMQQAPNARYAPTAVAVFVSPAGTADVPTHPWPLGELTVKATSGRRPAPRTPWPSGRSSLTNAVAPT